MFHDTIFYKWMQKVNEIFEKIPQGMKSCGFYGNLSILKEQLPTSIKAILTTHGNN
jgi:hypothetical protein